MPLDLQTVCDLRAELSEKLSGGKIEKIQQPEQDLLIFTIRNLGCSRRLLIRAGGANSRIHLTEQSYDNPSEAPMFCMLLRKHLTGARISDIRQPNGDRILAMDLISRNELGDSRPYLLMVELMGRAANLILADEEGRILDALRRIPPSETGKRALLPGLKYELPPLPPLHPRAETGEAVTTVNPAAESVSERLDRLYGPAEKKELQERRAKDLIRGVRRARDRQEKKLALQRQELAGTDHMEELRQEAELLQANLWRVKKGESLLRCENYFLADQPEVELRLDPLLTPQQNLQQKFRRYRKLRSTREHLEGIIREGEEKEDYLSSVLDELERAGSEAELEEIRAEMHRSGLLREQKSRKKKKHTSPGAPLRFVTEDDFVILVGRNNCQNDELTTKTARRSDLWFHVKDGSGSHVILCCEGREPTERAVLLAAQKAAEHSAFHSAGRVAVDYTMVRNVRKPSWALPGKVIYKNYQTILVRSE